MHLLGKIITSPWLLCPLMGLLLLVANLTEQPTLQQLEYPIYDRLLQFRTVANNNRVALISTDLYPGTDKPKFTAIIDQIHQLGGAQIGLLTPNMLTGTIAEDTTTIYSQQLIVAMQTSRDKSVTSPSLSADSLLLAPPLPKPQQLLPKRLNPLARYRINHPPRWNFSANLPDSAQSLATGHLIFSPDSDGKIRSHAVLLPWQHSLVPSLPLQLAVLAHGEKPHQLHTIAPQLSGQLHSDKLTIPVLSNYRNLLNIHPQKLPFKTYSSADLSLGDLPANALKGKVVLIGPINSYGDRHQVAGYGNLSTSELAALATATLLADTTPHRPNWSWLLETAVLVYFTILLILLVPRLSFRAGLTTICLFLSCWLVVTVGVFIIFDIWLKSVPAILLCLSGFTLVRWHVGSRKQYHHQQENNKILAQRFQEQGLLDLAFEKALLITPSGKSSKTMLYNLAIEFERKRLPHNAISIYQHILHGGRFRDTKTRLKQLQRSNIINTLPTIDGATVVLNHAGEKPTLGRYQIEAELGQGAMGTVYLGIDPKINRQVAIKTLAFKQMAAAELIETKERFFREAEAAGNLSHPNIVTIYDVGEEADLAFFAMEFLAGKDLGSYCQPKKLLPVPQVIDIITQTAAALDYAHSQGIVHRDIKPTNMVLVPEGQIKVTDFGIARITNTSQTETGIILGTPNYMSPEQVAGKKVDGRSDLFSLGVVMYELLSGRKPFHGESLTALLFNISTTNYRPLVEVAPKLPAGCYVIVDKLLQKTLTRRFKTAAILHQELQKLQQVLGE